MIRTLRLGLLLTALVAGIVGLAGGVGVVWPVVGFGVVATAIQMVAVEVLRGAAGQPLPVFMKRYGIGMGLRVAGVALLLVAIVAWPDRFPPLPTAMGFLGVLVPLLFLEARLTR